MNDNKFTFGAFARRMMSRDRNEPSSDQDVVENTTEIEEEAVAEGAPGLSAASDDWFSAPDTKAAASQEAAAADGEEREFTSPSLWDEEDTDWTSADDGDEDDTEEPGEDAWNAALERRLGGLDADATEAQGSDVIEGDADDAASDAPEVMAEAEIDDGQDLEASAPEGPEDEEADDAAAEVSDEVTPEAEGGDVLAAVSDRLADFTIAPPIQIDETVEAAEEIEADEDDEEGEASDDGIEATENPPLPEVAEDDIRAAFRLATVGSELDGTEADAENEAEDLVAAEDEHSEDSGRQDDADVADLGSDADSGAEAHELSQDDDALMAEETEMALLAHDAENHPDASDDEQSDTAAECGDLDIEKDEQPFLEASAEDSPQEGETEEPADSADLHNLEKSEMLADEADSDGMAESEPEMLEPDEDISASAEAENDVAAVADEEEAAEDLGEDDFEDEEVFASDDAEGDDLGGIEAAAVTDEDAFGGSDDEGLDTDGSTADWDDDEEEFVAAETQSDDVDEPEPEEDALSEDTEEVAVLNAPEAFPTGSAGDPDKRRPRICLMGEFSSGKSTLSNLLIGARSLPVNVTATHLPPVWISHGDLAPYRVDLEQERIPVDLNQLEDVPVEETSHIRIFRQADLLSICDLIDMPGISDPNMSAEVWQRMLPEADAVIWCTHATQAWRQSEAAVWDTVPKEIRDKSILLLTRMDKIRSERDRGRVMRRVTKETEGLFRARFGVSLIEALAAEDDEEAWRASGAEDFVVELVSIIRQIERDLDDPERVAAREAAATSTSLTQRPRTVQIALETEDPALKPAADETGLPADVRISPSRIRPQSPSVDPERRRARPSRGGHDGLLS